ncbi:MAG: hypothetical protein ACR2MX_09660 [Cyclobacteriaceae bacterium]
MLVDFEALPQKARIWVYQSNRRFTDAEVDAITESSEQFVSSWAAHGQPLKGSVKVLYHQFLILAVDEGAHLPSGCSIDSSVHFIKQLQAALNKDFFDRSKVAFVDGQEVVLESLNQAKEKIVQGAITGDTLTFNNLVQSKIELEREWKVPVKESWLAKYLDEKAAT